MKLLKFGIGWVISYHTLLGMWLINHVGIKVNTRTGGQSHFCWLPINSDKDINKHYVVSGEQSVQDFTLC